MCGFWLAITSLEKLEALNLNGFQVIVELGKT